MKNLFDNLTKEEQVKLMYDIESTVYVRRDKITTEADIYIESKKNIDDILFIMVLEIGLILSHLLVEVSPRYFIPATVPIMIIAAFNIYNTKWDKKIIINKK